jgi:hypothetical protein
VQPFLVVGHKWINIVRKRAAGVGLANKHQNLLNFIEIIEGVP